MKLFVSAGLGLVSAIALSTAASAQTAPAAAAAPPTGPVIPGVCVFSRDYAIGESALGKSVAARLKQLATTVDSELKAEQSGLEAEGRTIEAQRGTMQQDQLEQRILALRQKAAAFERKQQIRNQELQVTQNKQIQRIAQELQPILQQVNTERNCGIMIERSAVLAANPAMDVTQLAVQRLNAKITTVTFERERLDQRPAAAPVAAAPKPAAPPAKK